MRLLKKILNYTYRPIVANYLLADRVYTYEKISITVTKGVFHPGIFFSTKFLLKEIEQLPLSGKKLLELGSGTGLISIWAAKNSALVTASDINPAAVSCTKENALKNNVQLTVVESDLFDSISPGQFDYIIINPPYYRGTAANTADMAWYCGRQLEYFDKLFRQVAAFTGPDSLVLMVLSEDCEIEEIIRLASLYHLKIVLRRSHRFWAERNFIFEIQLV